MDIRLEGDVDGIEAAPSSCASAVRVPVVYLTAYADDRTLERAARHRTLRLPAQAVRRHAAPNGDRNRALQVRRRAATERERAPLRRDPGQHRRRHHRDRRPGEGDLHEPRGRGAHRVLAAWRPPGARSPEVFHDLERGDARADRGSRGEGAAASARSSASPITPCWSRATEASARSTIRARRSSTTRERSWAWSWSFATSPSAGGRSRPTACTPRTRRLELALRGTDTGIWDLSAQGRPHRSHRRLLFCSTPGQASATTSRRRRPLKTESGSGTPTIARTQTKRSPLASRAARIASRSRCASLHQDGIVPLDDEPRGGRCATTTATPRA